MMLVFLMSLSSKQWYYFICFIIVQFCRPSAKLASSWFHYFNYGVMKNKDSWFLLRNSSINMIAVLSIIFRLNWIHLPVITFNMYAISNYGGHNYIVWYFEKYIDFDKIWNRSTWRTLLAMDTILLQFNVNNYSGRQQYSVQYHLLYNRQYYVD